jgi:two-component system, LytTR family, response regulator
MSAKEITVLIADDEAHARNRLKTLLNDYPQLKIIAEAENGDQVLFSITKDKPDVAFLDINMPGTSVFNIISSIEKPPVIIFQTAYAEYGAKAFDIEAVDYLLKPVGKERFQKAVEKLLILFEKEDLRVEKKHDKVLSVKSGETIRIVKIEEIYRISFEDSFSFIYFGSDKIYSDKTLNYYDEVLEGQGFYRISRNEIINKDFISKIHPLIKGKCIVELHNKDKVAVSRRRIQGLKDLIC